MTGPTDDPVLSVEDLHVQFDTYGGTVRGVDGVSFDLHPGETVCLVGESGAGKTVTCESITGLIPSPPGEVTGGSVAFEGVDLTGVTERQLREIRGDRIAYVFQHPQNALDPVYTVGDQLVETIGYHRDVSDGTARSRALELLDRVDIAKPANRLEDYPHELSGGMRQRVAIALALAGNPDVLVADEPTADLDVTIEAQILDLLRELQAERDLAIVYVTHDLGIVAGVADRVVVMYAGTVVERATVDRLFDRPAHPYTQALLESLPGQGEMAPISGRHPDPTDYPEGCRFNPRCPHAVPECSEGPRPAFQETVGGTDVACVFYRSDRDSTVVATDPGEGSRFVSAPEAGSDDQAASASTTEDSPSRDGTGGGDGA
ncbi:MAG: ABC transporter ATP-binding protein [Halobacteriales archaeon]